jgi:hypothetical protein
VWARVHAMNACAHVEAVRCAGCMCGLRQVVEVAALPQSPRFSLQQGLRCSRESAENVCALLQVNLAGREINVGRPKGYIEPPPGSKQAANKVSLHQLPMHAADI